MQWAVVANLVGYSVEALVDRVVLGVELNAYVGRCRVVANLVIVDGNNAQLSHRAHKRKVECRATLYSLDRDDVVCVQSLLHSGMGIALLARYGAQVCGVVEEVVGSALRHKVCPHNKEVCAIGHNLQIEVDALLAVSIYGLYQALVDRGVGYGAVGAILQNLVYLKGVSQVVALPQLAIVVEVVDSAQSTIKVRGFATH